MIAASLHYFRRRTDSVPPALAALRGLGVDTVESPVPWSVHDDGHRVNFEADGAHLVAFLEEAAKAGLGAVLRLGPVVGADLTGLGLPRHVAVDRELAALGPDGAPRVVPVPPRWLFAPSCFSRSYRARSCAWIAAVAEVVRPFLAPGGPVRTVLLGDLWPFAGRDPVGSPDCHPDALAAWEEARDAAPRMERERMFRTPPGDVPGSSGPDGILAGIGLGRFAERGYVAWLQALAGSASAAWSAAKPPTPHGPDGAVALGTTLPAAGLFPPVGAGLLGRTFDSVGLDALAPAARSGALVHSARLLAGSARRPFASFLAVGAPIWLPHLALSDPLHGLRTCLAAGLGGVVLSMGVGRDRWSGGLLDESLREHESAHRFRRLLHGLGRSSWLQGRRRPAAALLVPRDYVRGTLAAAALLAGAPAAGLAAAFGFDPASALDPADESPGGGAWWRWLESAEAALQELGVPYALVDDECPVAIEAPLLLAPTLADAPRATLDRLCAQLARGAAVLCGPASPRRELAAGDDVPAGLPAPVAAPSAARIADALGGAHVPPPAPRLERSLLHDDAGAVVGLALVNRSPREISLGVALDGVELPASWSELDEPGSAPATGSVPPKGVRLLVPGARRKEAP
ncbi:MAG: beta-galactosidase [Deltaproteobacteria bacterium]|nr:beta-galactosidase [Deltaproteobacteria bacterium]